MTSRIFRSILIVAIAVLLASFVIITWCLYDYFDGLQEDLLQEELGLAAAATEEDGTAYLRALDSSYRLTWVAPDGSVLYDTQVDAAGMENHGNRAEIAQALQTGAGSSSRYSATLTEKTIYKAVRLSDGSVLRISKSHATAATLVMGMIQPIMIVAVLAVILSALLAGRMARRVVQPLNQLDLEHPLDNDAYEELSPLLHRIHAQHQQIEQQLRSLRQRQDELDQITGSMQEGLVLLDAKGNILSINPAARTLFGAEPSCVGQDFLTVDRSQEMSQAIAAAMAGGHHELRAQRGGREYQFDISRIESQGTVAGTVLLSFDVSEQVESERSRREFTANVSHELKTPLQSIIGSAELMENGLVKPEDMPRFVGHIRQEAARLVTLIEDIIRLSQLDEGGDMPQEPLSLLELAEEASQALSAAAEAKQVRLTVDGTPGRMEGVHRLVYEIVYNLCDNAIKYNVQGGRVELIVADTAREASLTVKDTGLGIAPEHQSRVFERFYRVDKSHSKQSGGTGLGLSIVKHAVLYHHGTIHLESTPGVGTTITVAFPKAAGGQGL